MPRKFPEVRRANVKVGHLGDHVESALTALGITKERVSKWLGKPCGCEERKAKLNALDAWGRQAVSSGVEGMMRFFNMLVGSDSADSDSKEVTDTKDTNKDTSKDGNDAQ